MPVEGEIRRHGCCVRYLGRGLLLDGPSGSGKTTLLCGLLAAGADLVADDQVRITRIEDGLFGAPVSDLGLLAIRGWGVVRLAGLPSAGIDAIVKFATDDDPLPEPQSVEILGVRRPVINVGGPDPVAGIAVALVGLRLEHQ